MGDMVWTFYCNGALTKKQQVCSHKGSVVSSMVLYHACSDSGLGVLFRADSVPAAASYIKRMAGVGRVEFSPFSWRYYLDNKTLFILIAAVALSLMPVRGQIEKLRQSCGGREVCVKGFSVVLLIICFLTMVNNSYSPFIYFRF